LAQDGKPLIAIDIDEVLFPLIREINEHHYHLTGKKHSLAEYTTTRFSPVWGIEESEVLKRVEQFLASDNIHIDPLPDALASLKFLSQWYRLMVLTARWDETAAGSLSWLTHHLPDVFENIHFAGFARRKADVCKELGVTTLVDDSLNMVAECADEGITAILFGNYPWNQADELPAGVTRAENWDEVVQLLTKKSR
jgi:uncharacterized HAD superfamily protein